MHGKEDMLVNTISGKGNPITVELNDTALEHAATKYNIPKTAVALLVGEFDRLCALYPQETPTKMFQEKLDVDGEWALSIVVDYTMFSIDYKK